MNALLAAHGGRAPSSSGAIAKMGSAALAQVAELDSLLRKLPAVSIATEHLFHAGLYARTITLPAGCALTGVLIRIPTLLIISGVARLFDGQQVVQVDGFVRLRCAAHRRCAIYAQQPTHMTMLFASAARSTDEAENAFTDEAAQLFSRAEGAHNAVIGLDLQATGEPA